MDNSQPSTSAAPEKSQEEAQPERSTGSGIKDTIESILVAFILAFVFRAFVVEAFVIPTGSMATTLLGAHTRFHCPDCGYSFDMDFEPPGRHTDLEGDEPEIPSTAGQIADSIYCPNCGFAVPANQKNDPPVAYGDRILVLKYLYLMHPPTRWDVVVFKAPIQTTTNYIKRLIGTPGESVEVIDGDVYIKEPGETQYKVQPKPPEVQKALWRLVYDNDYHPQKLDRDLLSAWIQPWSVVDGTGWSLDDPKNNGRVFEYTGANASSRLRFNPIANPTAQTTTDYLVYDTQRGYSRDGSHGNDINNSDLDLRATYQRMSGGGVFSMSLTKRGHIFTAEITPDKATLYHDVAGKRVQIGSPLILTSEDRPLRVELSNADYQVTLRIDDTIIAQTTPADYAPDMAALLAEFHNRESPPPGAAEIDAADQHCKVSHVSLWRDLYYINRNVRRATPDVPVHLNKDEFFVMGDNSAMSLDARLWDVGIDLPAENLKVDAGRVPAQFMLGKAFFVYWPAGYSANSMLPAFVPNFGAMRFIH
jgi:signal peptidase I/rubredoxin